jgi:hypothetical protein
VGTVTVYDRAGRRLGTVYLAFAPELGQEQMTARLTALIQEVLRRWEGALPRLAHNLMRAVALRAAAAQMAVSSG